MKFPAHIGRRGLWVLLALVAAGLALVVTRIAARGRAAAEALSSELLAPLDTAAMDTGTPADPLDARASDAATFAPPDAPGKSADPTATPGDSSASADSTSLADPAAPVEPAMKLPPLDPDLFPDWTSFGEAVPLARRGGRPVLLAFSAYGCELCDQLARDVFRDEAAGVTLRSAVVPVAVADAIAGGAMDTREVEELQRRFDVTSFPTLVLYFPASGRVRRLEGYPGRDPTLRWVTETASSRR